ncbi:MAG TPA: IS110 family transposase [Verrucomicrobiae bacterium]|nr:IS110 family transposase [Verrucomicrobiae bacterium]
MHFVAGVDAHKDAHSVAFINAVGTLVRSITIAADVNGYETALAAAQGLDGEVIWGLESTGCYARAFARLLLAKGFRVYEVPGSFTKRHRRRSSRAGKSDPLDAQAIAEAVLREAERLPLYETATECEALRLRYDQRDRLVHQRTEAVNRLRSAALRLDRGVLPADVNTAQAMESIERTIVKTRKESDPVILALVDELRFAVEDIKRINARIKEIEDLIRPIVRRLAPELLELRGVSFVVAAGLIGHAGSLRNCRNADAFAMRAGTAPVNCSSGKHIAVRVNRGGNRKLNRLLHVIAVVQLSRPDYLGRVYYDRKRSEGMAARAALRALKRRLTVVVYHRLLPAQRRCGQPSSESRATGLLKTAC